VTVKSEQTLFSTISSLVSPFKKPEKLLEALRKSDSKAIAYVLAQTAFPIKKQLRAYGLDDEKYRDFQHDGVIILIDKIKNNAYDGQVSSPGTFLIGICKNLILNHLRAKKEVKFEKLDTDIDWKDPDERFYASTKEMSEMLDMLLGKLGSPCKDLIRLKYLDGYRDEEIINLHLTHFSSADSLRNSRSQCMKKLIEIARPMIQNGWNDAN